MKRNFRGSCLLPVGCFFLGMFTAAALIIYLLYLWLFAGEKEEPFFPETPPAVVQPPES